MVDFLEGIPVTAVGIQLHRITSKEELISCEEVYFPRMGTVSMILRRAKISGKVVIGEHPKNHFADLLEENGDMCATVALDAKSYGALKNKWMRCKVQKDQPNAK